MFYGGDFLLKATHSLLLFGVPHRGMSIKNLHKVLSETNNESRITILAEELVLRRQYHEQRSDTYKRLITEYKYQVYCFYELIQSRELVVVGYHTIYNTSTKLIILYRINLENGSDPVHWNPHSILTPRVSGSPLNILLGLTKITVA